MEIQISSDVSTAPMVGPFVSGLKRRILESEPTLKEGDLTNAVLSAIKILAYAGRLTRGVPIRRTGLVLGKVQSGKTISASTVIALARDNGVRVVIYIAGTTNILEGQAFSRLKNYFSKMPSSYTDWYVISSKTSDLDSEETRSTINGIVRTWGSGRDSRALLINVQKNRANLDKLHRLVDRCALGQEPTLFIDDEADQASLNTNERRDTREVSATFSSINRLRGFFRTHLYLQYTATPQAPLLISIENLLSPDFAHVLDAGPKYVGGLEIFGNTATGVPASSVLEAIPESEDADSDDGGRPPESFRDCFLYFFLICADRQLKRDDTGASMLVHPHSRMAVHHAYRSYWEQLLRFQEGTFESERLKGMYRECFERHRASFDTISSDDDAYFSALFDELPHVTPKVTVVNSSSGSELDWDSHLFHVLIGGESLNRGFTVKNLVVTYMPRGRSGSSFTADTVQQRARFFGHNADVFRQIKVWMHDSLRGAFEEYVVHEESLRAELREREGQPLSAWRRHFFMDRSLNPTRKNVLSDDPSRHRIGRILRQSFLLDEAEIAEKNHEIVAEFLDSVEFEDFMGHRLFTFQLQDLVGKFLQQYKTSRSDSGNFITASLVLKRHLEGNPDQCCHVIEWGQEIARTVQRTGRITLDGESAGGRNSSLVSDPSLVTLQIFRVRLTPFEGVEPLPQPHCALQLVLPGSVSLSDGVSADFS